jgi:hypothetical protein
VGKPLRGRKVGLSVAVADGELVIRIGVATLAEGYEHAAHGQPYDVARNDFRQAKVTGPVTFAREVCRQLEREEEDGATLLSDMLDKACARAVEDGAEGVKYPEVTPHG